MELWGFEGFIVGNTYIRVYVFGGILVRKVKVMLSLRDDVVRRVRARLAMEDRGPSDLVEELLLMYNVMGFLDELCKCLGIEARFYMDSEVRVGRPRGFRAEDVVREVRGGRSERLSGYWCYC